MLKDRAIWLLAIGQTLIWAGIYYVFPAMLLRWEQALGWSKSDLTAAILFAVLASAIGAPIAGRIIDRGAGPEMMGLCAGLGGLGVVAVSQVSQLWQFYALWIGIGAMMAGCLYEPCFAMITRARGAQAKRAIVFVTLLGGFAGTIGFPVVHFLSEALGWRAALAIMGGFEALVVAPMLWAGARALQGKRIKGAPKAPATDRGFLRRPVFWLVGMAFASIALVHGMTLHHLLAILNERGLSAEFAVFIAGMVGVMQVAGRVAVTLADRMFSHHGFVVIAFLTLGAAVTILCFSGSNPALALAFVTLFGGAWGTISILRPVIARDLLGEADFGAKSGSLAVMYLTAAALSAWAGALIWQVGGYGVMLTCAIFLAGLAMALYGVAFRMADRVNPA